MDRDTCIGAGACVATVPGVFDQDDDGVVVVGRDAAKIARRAAVEACPSAALRWDE